MSIPLKILLIEDDPEFHPAIEGVIRQYMNPLGYIVSFDSAITIEEAVGKLACNRYDRVVSDLILPNTKDTEILDLLDEFNIQKGDRVILTGNMKMALQQNVIGRAQQLITKTDFAYQPESLADSLRDVDSEVLNDMKTMVANLATEVATMKARQEKYDAWRDSLQQAVSQMARAQEQMRSTLRAITEDVAEWKEQIRDYRQEFVAFVNSDEGTLDKLLTLQTFFSDLSPSQKVVVLVFVIVVGGFAFLIPRL